jgi:hypothetical protein
LRLLLVLPVVVVLGLCPKLEAAESDPGAHKTAQDVAARGQTTQGAEDGIEAIRIHGACLPRMMRHAGQAKERLGRQAERLGRLPRFAA